MSRLVRGVVSLSKFSPRVGDIEVVTQNPQRYIHNSPLKLPKTAEGGVVTMTDNCGPATVYHTLRTFGFNVSYEEVLKICRKSGSNESGMDGEQIHTVLKSFGLCTKERKLTSTKDMIPVIKKGGLYIAAVVEAVHEDDKFIDAGGHWFVVFDVDDEGNVLILNSSARTKNLSYGIERYKPKFFMKILTDFEGKTDNKFVYPPSKWYDKLVIEVAKP